MSKHITRTFVVAFAAAVRPVTLITTAALQKRRRSCSLTKRMGVTLLLVYGLIALKGSAASAADAGIRPEILGSTIVVQNQPTDPCVDAPQILSFISAASAIDAGTSTTLNWFIQAPDACQVDLVVAEVPLNWRSSTWEKRVLPQDQALLVQPRFSAQYRLLLSWGDRRISASTEVAVRLPIDPIHRCHPHGGCFDYIPDCSVFQPCGHTVKIDANDLAPLLVQALGTPNTTVIVKDGVELDLTPHLGGPISIAEGVQLIGERIARPGTPYQPGPRLFVTANPFEWNFSNWPNPLFRIEGDNVRFSGVHLEGPGSPPDDWRGQQPALGYTEAIMIGDDSSFFPIGIVIDHNEFYNWNTSVVDVRTDCSPPPCDGRIWNGFTNKIWSDISGLTYPKWNGSDAEPIYIHDNYFHDNFYGDPYFGYGVVVGGSHALIERNVFDGHHHAIAGGNDIHTGYRAYRNLVLKNGHGRNQQFDMHGTTYCSEDDKNANDGKGTWHQECGYAGHDIDIRWNSFQWRNSGFFWTAPDIKVRGVTSFVWPFLRPVGVVVKSNVFPYDNISDAVVVNGTGLADPPLFTVGPEVLIGKPRRWWDDHGTPSDDNIMSDPDASLLWDDDAHQSDECDFDGDGKADRLLTTGQTWWFRSLDTSKGPTPWVYLTTQTFLVSDVDIVHPSTGSGCDFYVR